MIVHAISTFPVTCDLLRIGLTRAAAKAQNRVDDRARNDDEISAKIIVEGIAKS